jgi:hypothetical protein
MKKGRPEGRVKAPGDHFSDALPYPSRMRQAQVSASDRIGRRACGFLRGHMLAELPGRHSAGDSQAYPHQSDEVQGLWPRFAERTSSSAIAYGGRRMSLWWLSFKGGATIIVRADTLVHARLLAAADKVGRAYLFDAGFRVDPEFEQIIPDNLIGRTLSRDEAADLQRWLRGDARYSRGR